MSHTSFASLSCSLCFVEFLRGFNASPSVAGWGVGSGLGLGLGLGLEEGKGHDKS